MRHHLVIHLANTEKKVKLEALSWGDMTWANIEKPADEIKEYFAQTYSFHPLDIDDCLSRIQRPRLDEYHDYLFLVLHFPIFNKLTGVTESSQVSIFIGERYLVIIHDGRLKPLVNLFAECEEDPRHKSEMLGKGSAYLLYRVIDRLVDYCFPILNKVGENIDEIEKRIFANKSRAAVRDISALRRDIISLRRIMGPMKAMIEGLEPKLRPYGQIDLSVYFGDTVDHLEKLWEVLDSHKEVIEGLNNAYDSLSSERINNILRILTILSTIGITLTVIASFLGMNIPLPGGADAGAGSLAWVALAVSVLLTVVLMLVYFRRRGWL